MNPKITTIIINQPFVSIHRDVDSSVNCSVFIHPTKASLARLEDLIHHYQTTAWLFEDNTVLFIHTNYPIKD